MYLNPYDKKNHMVTCIDITSLFQEKRTKALQIIQFLTQVKHQNILELKSYQVIDDRLIYIEMEMPGHGVEQWKNFCKKKFTNSEVLEIMKQLSKGVEFLHQLNFIHRDIHPAKI